MRRLLFVIVALGAATLSGRAPALVINAGQTAIFNPTGAYPLSQPLPNQPDTFDILPLVVSNTNTASFWQFFNNGALVASATVPNYHLVLRRSTSPVSGITIPDPLWDSIFTTANFRPLLTFTPIGGFVDTSLADLVVSAQALIDSGNLAGCGVTCRSDGSASVALAAVPEPATLPIYLTPLALGGLALMLRSRPQRCPPAGGLEGGSGRDAALSEL